MFDEKTCQELKSYVYMLIDPVDNRPFYIGKGNNNRVFDHLNCALSESETVNAKYDKIREIAGKQLEVQHVIVQHGLNDSEAFKIESALIDAFNYCGIMLTNKVLGHNSVEKGLMTSSEIIRMYNAEPLLSLEFDDCIIININRNYKRGKGTLSIYEATKETWTISEKRLDKLFYVLSEYRGLIVEVFEIKEWYPKERGYLPKSKKHGQSKTGWGFNGVVAPDEIRNLYINKSIAHIKKKGAASAIRYHL